MPWFGKSWKISRAASAAHPCFMCFFCTVIRQCRCQVAPTAFHFFHEITSSKHGASRPSSKDARLKYRRCTATPFSDRVSSFSFALQASLASPGPPLVTPSAALPSRVSLSLTGITRWQSYSGTAPATRSKAGKYLALAQLPSRGGFDACESTNRLDSVWKLASS